MALDFELTSPTSQLGYGVPVTLTIKLTGTGMLVSAATFTPAGPGTFSAPPTLPIASTAGASVTLTYTPNASGTVTVVASGGLVATHTLSFANIARARSTTATKIITQALGVLGIIGPGSSVKGAELQDALMRLNTLIDAWRLESMFAYATQTVTGQIPAGAKAVTVGPSGDIITQYRPLRLEQGSFYSASGLDYPITALTRAEYSNIGYKTLGGLGPGGGYYEPGVPNGTLHLYPQASIDTPVTLQMLTELSEFADLTTSYVLPPGYERALIYSLAADLADPYLVQLSPTAARTGAQARMALRRVNFETPALSTRRPRGNIYIGWEN